MPMPTFRRSGDMPLPNMPEPQAKPAPSTDAPRVRKNAYGAKCASCNGWVEANAGRLSNVNGTWIVRHLDGECDTSPSTEATVDAPQAVEHARTPFFDGTYTIEDDEGHRTFRLSTQPATDDFMPGVQLIAYLNGPDNDRDYVRFGSISPTGNLRVWRKHLDKTKVIADANKFLANPDAPNILKSVACYRCGKTLTVPASVHDGFGPECAKKGLR